MEEQPKSWGLDYESRDVLRSRLRDSLPRPEGPPVLGKGTDRFRSILKRTCNRFDEISTKAKRRPEFVRKYLDGNKIEYLKLSNQL